jgi:PTS system fructose-specific IIC component
MAFEVQLRAPHGGIFVIFAVDGVLWFFLSLIIGTVIGCAGVILLKGMRPADVAAEEESHADLVNA